MMSVWESFLNAAQILSSAGPIKHRLAAAYTSHLAGLHCDEMPREIRDEFMSLNSCLSAVEPLRGETTIQASVRKMSDPEAARHAQRIIDLMGAVIRLNMQPRQPVLRAVSSNE